MVRFLRDAVPNIIAGAVGVILAIVVGVGVYLVVDSSKAGTDAPTAEQTTSTP